MKYLYLLLPCVFSIHSGSAADIIFRISHTHSDTLTMHWVLDQATSQTQKEYVLLHNGVARWTPKLFQATVVRISDGKDLIYAIAESTDSLTITYDAEDIAGSFRCFGQGAEKYFPDVRKITSARIASLTKGASEINLEQCWRSINNLQQKVIDSISHRHDRKTILNIITGYYRAIFNYTKRRLLARFYPNDALTMLVSQSQLTPYLRQQIMALLEFDDECYDSPEYLNDVYYTLLQEYMTLQLKQEVPGDIANKYSFYGRYLSLSRLRERILCMLADTDFRSLTDTGSLTNWLQNQLQGMSPRYAGYLQDLACRYGQLFRKGEKAPDFLLSDSTGKIVGLTDLAGKVIVLDFWYRTCTPCLALFQQLAPIKDSLAGEPVTFLTVSIDDREEWLQALLQLKLNGLHVYTQGLKDRHPVIQAYHVNGYPTVCIIDAKGNIFNAAPPTGNPLALLSQIRQALALKHQTMRPK